MGDSPVLSICSVGDKVWVGFEIGYVLIFHSSTHFLFTQAWIRHYTPVVSVVYISDLRRVFVTLGNGYVMAFSDEVASLPSKDCCKVTLQPVSTYHDPGRNASCALAVPILNQLGNVASHELWVGQSEGMITVLDPNDLSIIKFIANTMDGSERPSYMAYLAYANLVCSVNSSERKVRREGGREGEGKREKEGRREEGESEGGREGGERVREREREGGSEKAREGRREGREGERK